MQYPKPQKGNPHKLTVNQHILPATSISRFAGPDGRVQIRQCNGKPDLLLKPSDPYFCARRQWDQKAEAVFMKGIEDRYQEVAAGIEAGSILTLDSQMNAAVSDMYLLWTLRHERYFTPLPDMTVKAVAPEREMSIDAQEILESKGYIFMTAGNKVPSRFVTGFRFVVEMGRERRRMIGKKWGICRSTGPEFLVPDNFSKYFVFPLSPTTILIADHVDQEIGLRQVADINGQAIFGSRRYYFARDITRCPILKPSILDSLFIC